MEQEVQKRIREAKEKNAFSLDLDDCGLEEIPKEVFSMEHLRALRISNNSYAKTKNTIRVIPKEIAHLKNLVYLSLCGNRISEIPLELTELKDLAILDLSDNQIKKITSESAQLLSLRNFDISNNPIEYPPYEIISQGQYAVERYFAELQKGKTYLREAKLIIVGYGAVGKTTLMQKLINPNLRLNEGLKSTEGIDIKRWKLLCMDGGQQIQFRANIWDFGGQEIYKTTHQFFLTKRSLYLFVWNARMDERYDDFAYWLNIVKLLSGSSPVIMVMNKLDERDLNIDEFSLKKEFSNIMGFYKISSRNGTNIPGLIEKIKEELLQLPHIGIEWPKTWADVRTTLENDRRDYIDYAEYKDICLRYGVNPEAINTLSQYLHDLGIILHFIDDEVLSDTIILKPEWGTNAVYRVLDTRKILENHGEFSFSDLRLIWQNYPLEKHKQLLQLMIKFELCFQIVDTTKYIVPQLLPAQMPEEIKNWPEENKHGIIRFEYRYKFLPEGIITRFICRNHNFIEQDFLWKNGVMLNFEGTNALVYLVESEKIIKVFLKGEQAKEVLFSVRKEFKRIHSTLSNLKVDEMIPCICPDCYEGDKAHFFNYNDLLRLKNERKRKTKDCDISGESVSIDALINGTIQEDEHTKDLREEVILLKEVINLLKNDFTAYKTKNASEEEKRLYSSLDNISQNIQNREKLEKSLQTWLPSINCLHSDTLSFLISGEFLFESLHRFQAEDYSPSILQYCRAVECELSVNLFMAFKTIWMGRVSAYDLSHENPAIRTFATYIHEPTKYLTLGSIVYCLKALHTPQNDAEIINHFKEFLKDRYSISFELMDSQFIKRIELLNYNYRNTAAHVGRKLVKDKMQPCKELIKDIFTVWASCTLQETVQGDPLLQALAPNLILGS